MAEVTAEVAQTVQPSVNGATTLPPTPEKQPAVSQPPTEKMEHFRTEERAVQLNLKGGERGFSLAFMIDPNDLARERIINLPDSRRDKNNLTDQQWQRVVILQQENKGQGEHLEFQIGQQKFSVAKADLAGDSAKVWLTATTGFEVLDFDPGTNAVTVRRIKRNAPIVPLPKPASESMPPSSQPSPRLERKPGAPDWKRKIIDIVPPIAIPFSPAPILENPAVPPPIIEEQPTGLPSEQALTEEGFLKPKPVMTEAKIPPEIREFPALDESLLCPAVSEWTIPPGGSLTRGLIEVNGLARYLNDEGKLDKELLYKDLRCLIAQPENLQGLEKSDPKVAELLQNLTGGESRALLGPLTSDMLSEALAKLNTSDPARQHLSDQLVIVQPGQTIQVPQFSFPGE